MTEEWRSILRTTRVRLRITQAQLAKQVGLSTDTVRGYETRQSRHPDSGSKRSLRRSRFPTPSQTK
jgi:transcriptional regulator with XRE-family HTH domain